MRPDTSWSGLLGTQMIPATALRFPRSRIPGLLFDSVTSLLRALPLYLPAIACEQGQAGELGVAPFARVDVECGDGAGEHAKAPMRFEVEGSVRT